MGSGTETLEFQAETRQLLQLVVHSLYSNKDIFLRELISNASDALDKLRLESLKDHDLQADISDLHIEIEVDKDERTLTIRDNGVGMSRDAVIDLIGTIAKSGTAQLLAKLKEAQDATASQALIGQFGVGFYSSFMAADRVVLTTRRAGEEGGTRWESAGEGTYQIEAVDDLPQGSAVTLHLKPVDTENHLFDYTADWKIKEIVKRYSDFIQWPIRMAAPAPSPSSASTDDSEQPPDEPQTLNSMKALWARPRSEVTEQEYQEFYRQLTHDWSDPLETIQIKAEGTFEYEALLFLPSRAPLDLFTRESSRGVQLYVNRVFIMDECEALMPNYLRFVKGVLDAHDLSLNISREILQHDRQIRGVRRRLVKKVLTTVKDLQANHAEKYQTFWKAFGRALKEGLIEDTDNRDLLLDLISVDSTHDADATTTLRQYVERMKDGQKDLYYLTGESRAVIENSPHMEAFLAKGYEVLILTDPIDEVWVDHVTSYDDKPLQSIAKGQVDLADEQEDAEGETDREQRKQDYAALLAFLTETLSEQVKEVRLSSRLTSSPACIVGDAHDMTPTLEKMYRAMGQPVPPVKRILELNPTHPLITGLLQAYGQTPENTQETQDENHQRGLKETAELLYGMALLAEGGDLVDPARFARLLADRLSRTL